MADALLVIRPALVGRVYSLVFGVIWVGLLGFGVVHNIASGEGVALIPMLPMLLIGCVIVSINVRMRVVVTAQELRVRNFVIESRFARGEIDRFVLHTPGGMSSAFGGVIAMLLISGRMIDLRATARGPFGKARTDLYLAQLEAWLRG